MWTSASERRSPRGRRGDGECREAGVEIDLSREAGVELDLSRDSTSHGTGYTMQVCTRFLMAACRPDHEEPRAHLQVWTGHFYKRPVPIAGTVSSTPQNTSKHRLWLKCVV